MIPIPFDERCISDEKVFSSLNLDLPALHAVREALNANNLLLAKQTLIHYLETRSNVNYYFDYRELPLTPIDTDSNPYHFQACLGLEGSLKEFCLYAGKKLMEHIYVRPGKERQELDLGPDYENLPHFNYFKDQGKKHRTTLDIFVRGQFFEYLSVLYHETGDRKVISQFEELLHIFWENYPLIVAGTQPDTSHFSWVEERDVMSVGWLTLSYVSLFYTRLPYEISTETAFELFKRIWFLGIQFRRFDTDGYEKYNHHMWERGLVPFILGTLFPEIPDFSAMRERGAHVIRQHIRDDFNEEGGYSEHSISYWCGAALGEMICRGVELSTSNHVPLLDEDTRKRIENSFNALALISPPGSSYPSLGDNGGSMVDPILQSGIISMNNSLCRELLEIRHGQRNPMETQLPLDYCNDKVGFFCSKSSHRPNANYILMSAKTNCGDTGHNHMDLLSLFITIHGQEFIGEPFARYLYHTAWVGSDLRGYLYNMRSHNVVLAYGNPIQPDELYAAKWGVLRPDTPIKTFSSAKTGCYVSACHDAYTILRHTRHILCFRSEGFLIRDELRGGDRMKKNHIQRWHLMPGVSWEQLNSHALLLKKNTAKALFLWSGNPQLCIWKNRDLFSCANPDADSLPWIIDVCFSVESFTPAGDIGMVSQDLLIMDVSHVHFPEKGSLFNHLHLSSDDCRQFMEEAQKGHLEQAIKNVEKLSKTITYTELPH